MNFVELHKATDQLFENGEYSKVVALLTEMRLYASQQFEKTRQLRTEWDNARTKLLEQTTQLRGLEYERDSLQREIESYNSVKNIFESVPLLNLREYRDLIDSLQEYESDQTVKERDDHEESLMSDSEDQHEQMIKLLHLEKQARQLLNKQLKAKIMQRESVQQELEFHDEQIRNLDLMLQDFMLKASDLQSRVESM
ncbi:hypothetical protein MP228_003852 [Amoeboaphelidium protococcarum]|nr:hypothetical protein MP228_003852 [Amoeboaphelidium protococcarum]